MLFLGLSKRAVAVSILKVVDCLVTSLIKFTVEHTHFHPYLSWRVLLIEPIFLNHINDNWALLR